MPALTIAERQARLRVLRSQQVAWTKDLVSHIRGARQEVAAKILTAARNPGISRNAGARETVYRSLAETYGILGKQLDAWGIKKTNEQAQAWHRKAVDDIARTAGPAAARGLLQWNQARLERYWQLIHPDNEKHLAAVFTDAMQEGDKRALRGAVVETLRQADLEGLTMQERHKRLSQKWSELAGNAAADKFLVRAGQKWEEARYLQMLTRTIAQRVARESYADTLVQAGFDLMRVVNVGENCDICNGWGGIILSITGSSKDYPSYQDSLDAGMWHPNCDCYPEYVDEAIDRKDIDAQAAEETPDMTPEEDEKFSAYSKRIADDMQAYREKAEA
jgi:hypothetical protein